MSQSAIAKALFKSMRDSSPTPPSLPSSMFGPGLFEPGASNILMEALAEAMRDAQEETPKAVQPLSQRMNFRYGVSSADITLNFLCQNDQAERLFDEHCQAIAAALPTVEVIRQRIYLRPLSVIAEEEKYQAEIDAITESQGRAVKSAGRQVIETILCDMQNDGETKRVIDWTALDAVIAALTTFKAQADAAAAPSVPEAGKQAVYTDSPMSMPTFDNQRLQRANGRPYRYGEQFNAKPGIDEDKSV